MQMIIKYKSRRIKIKDVKKLSEFGKVIGLMFHKKEKCPAMLFEFPKQTNMSIHSLFVFFPFAAVWLDDRNKVIEKRIVKPFQILVSCKKSFHKLVEIPLNKNYQKEIKILFKKSNYY